MKFFLFLAVQTTFRCQFLVNPGYTFGPSTYPGHLPPGAQTCRYYLNGIRNRNYQIRVRYFDFPKGTSCDDVRFTLYTRLSTAADVSKVICSDEPHCGEFVVPLPYHNSLGEFTVSDQVTQKFTGFLAVFEEVPLTP